jgi:uncharacterized OB-fold protein
LSSKVSSYPGTEVTPDEAKTGRYLVTHYDAELEYSWSSGVATGRYLRGLKEGELWGRKCNGCQRVMVPPRMYCEQCFGPTDTWVRLRDTGSVVTYSIAYVNFDASRRKEPIVVAVVEVDGASPMMGILHLLGDVKPKDVKIGLRVQAVWKKAKDRSGAITDIEYFRPLEGR